GPTTARWSTRCASASSSWRTVASRATNAAEATSERGRLDGVARVVGRFKLLVSEAWRSLGANLSTTFAATMTVLIGMFLLGLFIALGSWTVSWSNHVKKQLVVKVYFLPTATAQQKTDVARKLQQSRYVAP